MAQHYLALRPYIELLSIGENQALIIPQQIPTQNLALLRLGEHLELRQSQSRTSSLLLLLTSGGLIVYLLYKGLSEEERPSQRSQWSAQNWLRWLLFGDTNDLRGQYFGPTQTVTGGTKSNIEKLRKPNIVYVSPCPNCVRGVCKIRKHHQLLYHRHQYVPILESASTSGASTPNLKTLTLDFKPQKTIENFSADDETSEEEIEVKESPSRKKNRIPPEGREKSRKMARDEESMENIVGVSGSMVDLVKGAREVRRLIREASFDSLASEFSLDLQESLGGQTCANLDSIENEVSRLKDNCETMSEIVDFKAVSKNMKTSKSEYFSKESTPADLSSLSSSPDLRNLHKIIHTAPLQNKQLWTLTNLSDNDSNYSPMHRDISRYKITSLSSNTSECGEWEWDSEGLSAELTANPTGIYIQEHENWLQDDGMELDLEAELLSSTFKRSQSTSSDLDSSFYSKVRLPPSGRSSVMSHQEFQSFSRSSSSNSLYKKSKKNYSSDESGIEDKSISVTTPLSPVHEAKESPTKGAKEQQKTPKIHKPLEEKKKTRRRLVN